MVELIIFIASLLLVILGLFNFIKGINKFFKKKSPEEFGKLTKEKVENENQEISNNLGCGCLLIIVFGIILLIVGTVVF